MRRLLKIAFAGVVLAGCGADERPMVVITPDGVTTEIAACGTGCSGPTADELHHLSDTDIATFLVEVDAAPIASPTLALESLLFYGADTRGYLSRNDTSAFDAAKIAWLRAELERDEVTVTMRLVDDEGEVRGSLEQRVPMAEKQHLKMDDTGTLGRLAINGKVKRVGVDHLWARF